MTTVSSAPPPVVQWARAGDAGHLDGTNWTTTNYQLPTRVDTYHNLRSIKPVNL